MDASTAIGLGRQVLVEALLLMAPVLGVALVVGLLISFFQALTGLQEQTVAMVPKLLLLTGAVWLLTPWILRQLVDFAQRLLQNLSRFGGGP
ncbi:MAG TPA: flagellar biosynthetic protein FliQ [Planctomycetota bacterium]|jgi:flagellar biosynthetic protein FliQ|nr:flagellar biosynthetic protein FliQ [Planctomycetota bacterium]